MLCVKYRVSPGSASWCFLLALLLSGDARAAEADGVILVSVEGAEKIRVESEGGSAAEFAAPHELQPGDTVHTGKGVAARMVYPDGTEVLVGGDSAARIEPKVDGIQWTR